MDNFDLMLLLQPQDPAAGGDGCDCSPRADRRAAPRPTRHAAAAASVAGRRAWPAAAPDVVARPTRRFSAVAVPGSPRAAAARFGGVFAVMAALLLSPLPAAAADIKVLTAGAFKPVLAALVPDFERTSGHHVTLQNDTAGALAKRIEAGERFDVVVLTPAALQPLAGKLAAAPPQRLARVAIGVAVKQGAPSPDIGSVAAFKQALLAARAVAVIDPAAGGSSGVYLARLFETMGIAAQMRPKLVLVPGGLVAERLVSGEADLAIHQISEIRAVPGVMLVGPLPAEIQNETVYAGALSAVPADAAAAQALLDLLASPAARAVLVDKGMQAP